MRKKFLRLLLIGLVFSTAALAQTNKTKPKAVQSKAKPVAKKSVANAKQSPVINSAGWSQEEKTVFFDACVKELNWSKDSSSRYCTCMLAKIEKLYPSAKDSENMTQEKAVELAKECLAAENKSTSWGPKERTEFTTQCEAAATKNLGAEKAKSYCACMLVKVEKEFPNPSELTQMKQETVAKWAEECNKQ